MTDEQTTANTDHIAAAAIHRAAAAAHRADGGGAEWRSLRAEDWSRTAECHDPAGGFGPGREDSRLAVNAAREAALNRQRAYSQEQASLDRSEYDQQTVEQSRLAAEAHDRAAAEHEQVASDCSGPPPASEVLDRMVEEVAEYLQTEASPMDVIRVHRVCTT